jgi:release factor glutamine methyltransferase
MNHTIAALLESTLLNKIDAKVLLGHLINQYLGWPRSALISRDQEPLPNEVVVAWKSFEARRLSGIPVAYLTGIKGFHGIELKVNEAVLIPRPETELLVDLTLEEIQCIHMSAPHQPIRVLDLGTGSGAIALAIAHLTSTISEASIDIEVLGIDQSSAAIELARDNAIALGLDTSVTFLTSNWYAAIPDRYRNTVDIIVSNPPYIQKDDPHLQAGDLRFEPQSALTDYGDGLSCIRQILDDADQYLKPGGLITIEHGYDQAAAVTALMKTEGFQEISSLPDLAGHLRVSLARK